MHKTKMLFAGITAFVIWLAIGIVLAANQGCGTKYVSGSGRELPAGLGYAVETLESSKLVYDSVLTIGGQLHCDKAISDDAANKIVTMANGYYFCHNAAQMAVAAWAQAIEINSGEAAARASAYAKLITLAKSSAALLSEFQRITGKKIGMPDELNEGNIQLSLGGEVNG